MLSFLTPSRYTAKIITIPLVISCQKEDTSKRVNPFSNTPSMSIPTRAPVIVPIPPARDIPPSITDAMTTISKPVPAVGCAEPIRDASRTPASIVRTLPRM